MPQSSRIRRELTLGLIGGEAVRLERFVRAHEYAPGTMGVLQVQSTTRDSIQNRRPRAWLHLGVVKLSMRIVKIKPSAKSEPAVQIFCGVVAGTLQEQLQAAGVTPKLPSLPAENAAYFLIGVTTG
jgi:hypothetical protein